MTRFRTFLASLALAFVGLLPFAAPPVVVGMALTAPTAQAQDLSDYAENNSVDFIFRAQTWTIAANFHIGLGTAACSDSSVGTEVTGGSYARVSVARSLANWAGTQSAGSTTASSGTGGVTSNNGAITFPAPTANWGSVTHFFIADAPSGGNLILCKALTTAKTVNSGDAAPSFAAGALTVTFQ